MKLIEFINAAQRPVLVDGAMGTQLDVAGVAMGGQACITTPDIVAAIHKKYADAHADLIITNTLTMNRISIEAHKVGVDVREVNLAGVRLAKSAIGPSQYVLGDIGSTGRLLKPYGPLSEDAAYQTYVEQSQLLAEGGVDGFIIETMIDLREALIALKACRDNFDLPVITSISFDKVKADDAYTFVGNTSRACAKALTEAGASVIGTNCGSLDPFQMAEVIAAMREVTGVPLIAMPNAGRPRVVGGKDVWDMQPDEFAKGVIKCVEAGAKVVGGCCGTSPAHIQAVADLLGK